MSLIRRVFHRFYNVIRPRRAETQLTREVASHLELLEDRFRAQGLAPHEARAAARRAFGGVEQAKELQRDARSFLWLEDVRRDVGYGARTLARTRGFTTVAVITLALGISAVTIIYSVVRNVVLDPFPYSRSDRMVNVVLADGAGRRFRGPYFPAPEFLDYQEQTDVFEDVVGTSLADTHWVSEGGTERLTIAWMTPNGFSFLGVPPMLGRVFGAADAAAGAPPVAVMNHRTWVRLFAADPAVVGRTLVLNGQAWTVIGVMPPRFEWNIADLWLPAELRRSDDVQSPQGFRWAFQAHLRPDVTAEAAEAQLNVVGSRRAREQPNDYPPNFRFQVIKVIDWVVRDFRGVLYTLFGAVSLLLVIACCNVANMLLARATVREREIRIRAAIGASRSRIVRQLLVESTLLAAGGLVAGCVLAYVGIEALAGFMPRQGVPWETEIRLDRPVLLFAVIASAMATIGFGLFPALQSARRDVMAGASITGRATTGRRQTRIRSGLVVAQVALSIVLLVGAGLLMRTFVRLANVDLGFDPRNVLTVPLSFPPGQSAAANQRNVYRQVLDRISTIPGVRSAALANGPAPFGGSSTSLQIPGLAVAPEATVVVMFCSERLVETIGGSIAAGRPLTAFDVEQSRQVTLVNETFARRYFAGADPLRHSIRLERLTTLPVPIPDPTFEIVGVVRDVANQGPNNPPVPQAFIPFTLRGPAAFTLLLRSSEDPMRLLNTIRREIHLVSRDVAVTEPSRLDDWIQRVFYARPRFSLLVLGIFAITGIVLVAFGVYGVLAYTVSQQTREIAIRMALGGERGHVVRMVLQLGMKLVGAGVIIGVAISLGTNRLLVSQLWNTSPADPMTFGAVVTAIVAIGALACWIPARRAVRVEPTVALRHE